MPESRHQETVIIGAGPAGLAAALELVRSGAVGPHHGVTVLEKDSLVGGIARTVNHKGFRFDIGGHRFFTKNERIRALWREILGDRMLSVPRISRIHYRGKFFQYPLRPFEAARKLGPFTSLAVAASYARARIAPRRPERSFEDWVVNRFGERLFDIFFRTYTEKVWGIPTDQISADWAAQRIRGLSLRKAVLDAFRRSNDPRRAKTLIHRFQYPELGPGQMWEEIARIVSEHGVRLLTERRVVRIRHDGERIRSLVVRDDAGVEDEFEGSSFLSSMPMRDLVLALDPPPPPAILEAARTLRYRDFILVALVIDRPDLFPDNWIYVHSPEVAVGRIQNFKNWSPRMVPDPAYTCLGMEYFCNEGDEEWNRPDAERIRIASEELAALGLAGEGRVVDGRVVRMEKTYPMYDHAYARSVAILRAYLARFGNLQLMGRNGMHKYNNQDHSMLTGILAAENLLGARHDLWAVNAEAEYLEMRTAGDGAASSPP